MSPADTVEASVADISVEPSTALPTRKEYNARMSKKPLRIADHQLRLIVATMGACLASDRIIIDGCKVGYCYREKPESEDDSGWRFFAGDEQLAYLDDADNLGLYELNTVANYDEGIVGVLEYPVGSAFKRSASGAFEPAPPVVSSSAARD